MSTALITGASSGIGRALAEEFAAHGHDLILVARNQARLDQVAESCRRRGVQAVTQAQDLAVGDGADALAHRVAERGLAVDILVNDAGIGLHGLFHESDLGRVTEMVRLNVEAVTRLTHLMLPAMLGRGRGRILNVSSTTAYFPGPYLAVYYATKAYVASFSDALHTELRGTGVSVTTLCPGLTPTHFQERAGMKDPGPLAGWLSSPESVARRGYRGLMEGRRSVVPGRLNAWLAGLARTAPRGLVTELMGLANSRRHR